MDLKNMKARKVLDVIYAMEIYSVEITQVGVFTDPNVAKLLPMQTALASLQSQIDLPFEVYDNVVAEPTEDSWRKAITWAREHDFSHFLAYVPVISWIPYVTCLP